MKIVWLILLVLASSCGAKKSHLNYGKATKADLIAEKGEPLTIESVPSTGAELYKYENNEMFQVEKDVVAYGFKDPQGDEKLILYWKHKFKDCNPKVSISTPAAHHTPAILEMKCDEQGTRVYYSDGSEFVSRIIEHEKK